MTDPANAVPEIVRELKRLVGRLENAFPGRKFTLDGHLVGSIGEVLAAHYYGLSLLEASTPAHDASAEDGRLVQVKMTQGKSVGLRADCEHLLVLRLESDGTATEVYNGPGAPVWAAAGKLQSNGQRPIGVARLKRLASSVPASGRLPWIR